MRFGSFLLLFLLTCVCFGSTIETRRESFEFRYDILPLLHRQGCGSAYCHGAATGMGGFKLSLFASDPEADHHAITRDLGGRRLDLRKPSNSLLLRKPSLQTPHKGGRRLREGEHAHAALRDWIASGAPYQRNGGRELLSLKLTRVDDRLRATAKFRDRQGTFERDVTELCTFRSSDDRIVAVDDTGKIEVGSPGEAWMFARYVTRSARLAVVQPFAEDPAGVSARDSGAVEAASPLDRLWLGRLRELGLQPAAPAPMTVLARRLYLDLTDRLPTPDELRAFEKLEPRERVPRAAAGLVETADFAVKFGRHLAEWVEIPLEPPARPRPQTQTFHQQHQRLVAAVRRGDKLHVIAERLLVQDRTLLDRFPDPRDRSELTGRAFLGIRIGCARCHNSPIDKWERKDHMAFSALFASQRPNPNGGMMQGILFDPDSGAAVQPRTLPVGANPGTDAADREQNGSHAAIVARFVLHGGHGMFERNVANRTFAALMGRGLVEPLDDNRLSNPAVHESLLDHLAKEARTGNLRDLVLHIVNSRLYQTSSRPSETKTDSAAIQFFARRVARSMPPEMFAKAVARSLGEESANRLTRSPLARQLALLNSPFLNDAVKTSASIADIAVFAPDARTRLRDLFILLLSRQPREDEVKALLPTLEQGGVGSVQDLAFALLASREFGSIR